VLQGADLLRSLTRLQLGDGRAVAGIGVPLAAVAGDPGTTNILQELKGTPFGSGMNQMDVMTLNIMAMLFDQLFDDPNIPAGVKGLIGRLQIPMLKVAIADKSFFSKKTHPARQMLDTLGEISARLPADVSVADPQYGRLETILQQLIVGYEDDISIFEDVRGQLEALLAEEDQRVEQETLSAAKHIEQEESLALAKTVAQAEIKVRVRASKAPRPVIEFLVQQWVKLLLVVQVKDGEDSEAWRNALETTDLLLWSVEPKETLEERRKLVAAVPDLLKRLADGLGIAGVDDAVRVKFFSDLRRLHSEVIGKAGRSATADSAAAAEARPGPAPADPTAPADVEEPGQAATAAGSQQALQFSLPETPPIDGPPVEPADAAQPEAHAQSQADAPGLIDLPEPPQAEAGELGAAAAAGDAKSPGAPGRIGDDEAAAASAAPQATEPPSPDLPAGLSLVDAPAEPKPADAPAAPATGEESGALDFLDAPAPAAPEAASPADATDAKPAGISLVDLPELSPESARPQAAADAAKAAPARSDAPALDFPTLDLSPVGKTAAPPKAEPPAPVPKTTPAAATDTAKAEPARSAAPALDFPTLDFSPAGTAAAASKAAPPAPKAKPATQPAAAGEEGGAAAARPAPPAAAAPPKPAAPPQEPDTLDFSAALTVKNPFGEGEVQVDDLDFTVPAGGKPAGGKREADAAAVPANLAVGSWVEIRDKRAGKSSFAKLSFVTPLKTRYLFVNRQGNTVLECSRDELARRFKFGELAVSVEVAEVPLFDRIAGGLVDKLGGSKPAR
jgi:hypothetical protein